MITILPYIITRLFIRKRYTLEGDELRHLATARNFYKFWNRSFYDFHPPLYSWFIRYLKSGVMVSFLCSLGLYVVSSKLYDSLLLTPPQKAIALTFLAFNYTLIYYSNRTFRYQLAALLGTLTIYLLVNHCYLAAGFSWGLLGLTCTFAGLRGFFVWALLGFNPITLLTFLPIFGIWFVEKVKVYMDNEYYPSGQEGKIERVRDFTWKQLLSPMYFPWAYSYYGKSELGYDFRNWFKKIAGVFGLYPPLTFLLPFALFFMVKGMINSPLWVSILVVCLLYPSLYKRFLPRNSIIAIPLIGFLLAKGMPDFIMRWLF